MLHKTRGIVLRTVKYGDTSMIVSIFTELFGMQSYIVNGVRSSKPKAARGNLLQPGNILELVVYHQEIKNLQRIAEFKLAYIFSSLHFNIVKNTVALYMIELLQKTLKQPEQHLELYYFVENAFEVLDKSELPVVANMPLFFTLKVGEYLGFRINGRYSEYTPYLDLQEGHYTDLPPHHIHHLEPESSQYTDALSQCTATEELASIVMNKERRRKLLYAYLEFFRLHLPDFVEMQSPPILHDILDA
ncbi:DNA repair protein RecO [Chitinophaga sp. sic0106]|uniref:DNA repair protein RecO n=1 Tax=Chitinophaga sp. sic0106 TaxID=2854785 RepID=UPI001C47779A|nr:DNA repair protein RecO [Chitinophaga sp. sic0106]MBV7533656.1 DNA repair protein RecO [Chitinophaga sp. sic0106]